MKTFFRNVISGLALLMLPLGWVAGRAIGRSLTRLRERSLRIARFDFTGAPLPPTLRFTPANSVNGTKAWSSAS